MIKPTLALCIAAYNAAEFLPRLLDSAQKQFIKFDEVLVYDDCSKDTTVQIAQEYGVKIAKGDINRGPSFGRNKLAEMTNCEWIHFHDADDELMPNFTTLAHKWMISDQALDVILFDYEYRDNDSGQLYAIRKFDKNALEKDPIRYAICEQINPFCGLYRRKEFLKAGGFDASIRYNEDTDLHIQLAICGLRFSSESEVSIINYRIKQSVSQSASKSGILKCLQGEYYVMKKHSILLGERYKSEIAIQCWEIGTQVASFLDWKTAYGCVELAVKLNGRVPQNASGSFKVLCLINPFLAIRIREYMIRIFRPNLRFNR